MRRSFHGGEQMISEKKKIFHDLRASVMLLLLTVMYAAVALIGLGDREVPVTQPDMGEGNMRSCLAYAAFDTAYDLEALLLYKGLGVCGVTVYVPDESGTGWTEIARQACDGIYLWEEIPLDCSAEMICVSVGTDEIGEVFEAGFRAKDGTVVPLHSDGHALFDEQELVPTVPSHLNGMIFDEVYHARTAYEHLHGMSPYENSHPPLGKLITALGIALLGMNPFGWRIMGCLIGIAMLPVLYVLAKRLFGSENKALAASAFLALDFMHFTQTRTALIDAPAVMLILIMYSIMGRYYMDSPEDLPYPKVLRLLAVCGFVLGLGIAVKWTAAYAALGLAVLFVLALIRRHRMGDQKHTIPTCLWCILFFGLVPLTVYVLSYIPYFLADPAKPAWKIFWDSQIYMLTYHSGLDSVHAFSSPWYSWPLMLRPMWYYGSKALAYDGLCSSIVAFGNPVVWWCGTACAILLLFKRKKTRADVFVLIGLGSQYLPWALIPRATFIYHFFASVPFVILAMIEVLGDLSRKRQRCRYLMPVLLLSAALLFVMFYPVLSGAVVDREYVMNILSWLPGWILGY